MRWSVFCQALLSYGITRRLERTTIRALTRAGHSVVVVAGAPPAFAGEADACGAQAVIQIPLPTWGRLDGACAWEAYVAGAAAPATAACLAAFAPEAALSVDWHGWAACEAAFPD
ncbi:hypothetical protein H632_c2305p0, partial [Helicosporidium sp. ATCC 50920]